MNHIDLIGRLTADPELKQTPSGTSVCTFTLAVQRQYKNKDGSRTADFINIVTWRQQAEFVSKYFKKGSQMAVGGSLQTRQYTDKNGNKRTAFEVMADSVEFVGSNNQGSKTENKAESFNPSSPAPVTYSQGDAVDFAEIDDDDLPF